ncbi:hypothetical protein M9Y10_030335 [Tritrichomonas musculus]|uniref:Rab-GAP TBC domain-containing protein n=1 Tax=Tritrichomonas musculus TaxID=1915356 RepID=A0ABR2KQH1_9EUKA
MMEYKMTDSDKSLKMEMEEKYLSSSKNEIPHPSSFSFNRFQDINDFFNKFLSSPNNTISKNDSIWKDIISSLFDIDSLPSIQDNQRNLTLKFTTKEYQKIERKKEKYGENNMNLLKILKIKNKRIAKKFKHAVMEGIPDELRGLIWKIIIDPLNSDFETLKSDIIDLINIGIDDNYTDGEDIESQYNYCISFSSCYSNHCSISYYSIENYDTQSTCDAAPLQFSNHSSSNSTLHYLAKHASKNAIREIENDLDRTLVQFEEIKSKQIQKEMKNILSAYSVIDKDIDFTQGMSFLVGLLLCFMDEYTSFNCFCIIMFSKRFNFREFFIHDFPGVVKMNKIWKVAIQKYYPKINQKLNENNVDPIIYTVGWWLTAFSCFPFPKNILLMIFDRYLLFGPSSLISFGLIILNVYDDYLKHLSVDELISFLQSPYIHPKMNDILYIRNIWNKKFLITEKQYNKFEQKAFKVQQT